MQYLKYRRNGLWVEKLLDGQLFPNRKTPRLSNPNSQQ